MYRFVFQPVSKVFRSLPVVGPLRKNIYEPLYSEYCEKAIFYLSDLSRPTYITISKQILSVILLLKHAYTLFRV